MQKRPAPILQLAQTDKFLEALGYLILLATWLMLLFFFKNLPDTIPVHYNYLGQPDRFGPKASIFVLPIIATIVFVAMTMLNKYPQVLNCTVRITEDNAQRQYAIANRMIRFLKGSIVLVFGLITFQTIRNANHPDTGLGIWFLPIFLAMIFIPIIYFTMQSFNAK
jgi:uncharacterized membrane protein